MFDRSRVQVAALLVVTIAAGLGSRSAAAPAFVARHAGDALWTVAVYFALAWAAPSARVRTLGLVAVGISFAVETSQLVHVGWLDGWRRTLAGRLVLGSGWQWADLPRYVIGALCAAAVDFAVLRSRCPSPGDDAAP